MRNKEVKIGRILTYIKCTLTKNINLSHKNLDIYSIYSNFAPKFKKMGKMIHLCLAKMSETGMEQKYIQEAFDTQWVAPLGPNVNAFEKDLE